MVYILTISTGPKFFKDGVLKMKCKKYLIFIVCLIVTVGCGEKKTTPPEVYSKAAVMEPPEPEEIVMEVVTPLPLPGQLQAVPPGEKPDTQKEPASPAIVIDTANKTARSAPTQAKYFNSIMRYDYTEGALYQLYAAPLKFTNIQLQPGETLTGAGPVCGDTVRWIMGTGVSEENGQTVEHIFLKPTEPGLHTTFMIPTNRRTYHLEIHSYQNTYMASIKWRYPHDEVSKMKYGIKKRQEESDVIIDTHVNLKDINNNYNIAVTSENKKISWVPSLVFDDKNKTFIRFPKTMLNQEAPVLYVMSNEDETQLVNYRVKKDYYIVDRLFQKAQLRLGQKNQDIVTITRAED